MGSRKWKVENSSHPAFQNPPPSAMQTDLPRILIVGNYPADGQESMLRFARMLEEGFARAGWPVESISPRAVFGGRGGRPANTGLGKWLAYVDKFLLFPWTLRRRVRGLGAGAVVHLADHSNAMYAPAAASAGHRVLITCHDLGAVRGALGEPTDCPASRTGRVLQRWIRRSLGRADVIACDSAATRADVDRLIRRPGGTAPDTRLVHIGLNAPYRPLPAAEADARLAAVPALAGGRPFALHVGSGLRRKNREGVLRIFARLRDDWPEGRLVFAGEAPSAELTAQAAALGVAERVVAVTRPPDELLEALYSRAAAFLFPSTFEGFGWPVVEAQACGCPVLSSDAGSLAEVAGEGAFVRPVADEAAFAEELRRIVRDPGVRAAWTAAGFRNAARFTEEKMRRRYADLYRELAGLPAAAEETAPLPALSSTP